MYQDGQFYWKNKKYILLRVALYIAALILSLETVFGIIFFIIVYNEQIITKLSIGFVFISIAVIVSETKLNFLKKIEETCTEEND